MNRPYIVLGDFNACVGSRTEDDLWWHEMTFWTWLLNEAGGEMLSFLATNDATICNTWFKKKDIH